MRSWTVLYACPTVQWGGGICDHYHNTLDLTAHGPPRDGTSLYRDPTQAPALWTWHIFCTGTRLAPVSSLPRYVQNCSTCSLLYRRPLLVTSCGQDWRPVQTCLLEDTLPRANIWWLLKHVQSVNGWYASS